MPLPTSLVEKNGSQIFSTISGGDAGARVAHFAQHIFADRHGLTDDGLRLFRADVLGLHRQRAAIGHGVAGVDREIDDHLLELMDVNHDQAQVAAVADLAVQPSRPEPGPEDCRGPTWHR